MTQTNSTDNYSVANFIVSATAGQGNYTTIASAIAAATAGDTIFIKPGIYKESLTLVTGINLTAFDCDALTPNVTISGLCTYTSAGTVSISGINLETDGDFCLAVTGSSASVVNLTGCYITCSNNTGISFTSSSSNSVINIFNCLGDIETTGITLYSSSSAGNIKIQSGNFSNSGGSTTISSNSSGVALLEYGFFFFPLGCTSTGGMNLDFCSISTSAQNAIAVTANGTNGGNFGSSKILSGSASGITIGTGASYNIVNCRIESTNTNSITGLGTLNYSDLTFTGASSTINTSTVVQLPNGLPLSVPNGGTGIATMTTAYAPLCAGTSPTGSLQVASTGLSNSGYVLTSNGSSALPSFQINSSSSGFTTVNIQSFTASGTYTPTSGMVYCIAYCQGGGGGGGGTKGSASECAIGAGGGAGGYDFNQFSAATIGASQIITVGAGGAGGVGNSAGTAGGTSSLGSLLSCTGGSGGSTDSATVGVSSNASGGAGGTGTSGVLSMTSSTGGAGSNIASSLDILISGSGASSTFGSGAPGTMIFSPGAASANGTTATAYGSGGAGAYNFQNATARNGGAGGAGVITIIEYIS